MSPLTGTTTLVLLALRRDRVRLAIWVAAIVALVYFQAVSLQGLYPDPGELAAAGQLVEGNAAFIAMAGPPTALDTLGGRTAFEVSAFGIVLTALMNIFFVTRHMRAEEESGRAEVVRSTVTGRHAALAAVLLTVTGLALVLTVLITASLVVLDLRWSGSLALALCITGPGLVFAGIAALTSQVVTGSRSASGLAGAALAASYVLRAAGDIGNGVLSWLSPMGWGQALRPFAGERWWVLAVLAGATAGLAGTAVRINARRDLGAGLVPPRPGPPRAPAALLRRHGLTVRLHRGAWTGWGVGIFLGGLAYGSIGGDVEDLIGDNELIADIVAAGGGNLVDAFLGTTSLVLAVIATGYAIQAALRPQGEEQAGRVEALLATPTSRPGWLGGHLAVVTLGTAVVLALAGAGTGLSYGLVAGDLGDVPRLALATLGYAPASLVLVGLTVALYGLAPRLTPLAWAALGLCFVIDFLGEVLRLPGWLKQLSPFQHVARLPAEPFNPVPLVLLLALAGLLAAAGLAAFRHRDLATT